MAAIPESATRFMAGLVECARQRKKTIVFPEGFEPRVREAAARLARDGVVRPVLLGPKPADAPPGVTFLDPAHAAAVDKYAAIYYERRRAKGVTAGEAALRLDEAVAVARWRTFGRKTADLLWGGRLGELQRWAAGREDLTRDEQAFLEACASTKSPFRPASSLSRIRLARMQKGPRL